MRAERAVIGAVALTTVLAPLNSTMIAVALPRILDEFHTGVATGGWLVTAYLIAMAALQPVAGKLGDRLGRRRLVLGGLAWFGFASLGAGVASGLPILLLFRVQQAVAGAIALPNSAALVSEIVPPERRGARFGLVGAAATVAAATGPPLGGVLVRAAGWRAIFYVNLPVAVAALLLAWRAIPARRPAKGNAAFDITGSLLLSAVLIGTAVLLARGRQSPTPVVPVLGVAGVVLAVAAFLRHELRHPDPVLQPRFFGRRAFAAANGAVALSNLAMYVTLLTIPILLSRRAGWSDVRTGLVLTSLSAASAATSPFGGRLADRLGRRRPAVAGLVLLALGLAPLAVTGGELPMPAMLAGLGLAGAGLGLSSAALQTAAIEAVGAGQAGVASGVFSTSRYFGSIVGSSVLAGLLGPARGAGGRFGAVFVVVAVAAGLSVLAAARLPGRSRAPAAE